LPGGGYWISDAEVQQAYLDLGLTPPAP
jgi:hypothetical protein